MYITISGLICILSRRSDMWCEVPDWSLISDIVIICIPQCRISLIITKYMINAIRIFFKWSFEIEFNPIHRGCSKTTKAKEYQHIYGQCVVYDLNTSLWRSLYRISLWRPIWYDSLTKNWPVSKGPASVTL